MKVKVNLNDLTVLDRDIDVFSEYTGEQHYQGMDEYQVKEIRGVIYFDKAQFTELCLETVKKEYEALRFNTELSFKLKLQASCDNGYTWDIKILGEPKEDDEENVYFDNFEVV